VGWLLLVYERTERMAMIEYWSAWADEVFMIMVLLALWTGRAERRVYEEAREQVAITKFITTIRASSDPPIRARG
jgi:hypothetical protein